jgi:hypothetical protein
LKVSTYKKFFFFVDLGTPGCFSKYLFIARKCNDTLEI